MADEEAPSSPCAVWRYVLVFDVEVVGTPLKPYLGGAVVVVLTIDEEDEAAPTSLWPVAKVALVFATDKEDVVPP